MKHKALKNGRTKFFNGSRKKTKYHCAANPVTYLGCSNLTSQMATYSYSLLRMIITKRFAVEAVREVSNLAWMQT